MTIDLVLLKLEHYAATCYITIHPICTYIHAILLAAAYVAHAVRGTYFVLVVTY